jgi:HD-GYP domain-containing protein (c-di-GMP phosphodiesterase class II)
MAYAPLASVSHRVQVGAPLPFDLHDADQHLLLARGQRLESVEQYASLVQRGAMVNLAQMQSAGDVARLAPREALPRLWTETLGRISDALAKSQQEGFRAALDDAAAPALALVERDPDLAIFQVLQQGAGADAAYGARRSLQSAITASLVAQRLAWQPGEVEKAFKVALTMNLSMLELQGELARQTVPPSPEQRAALRSHPMRSVQMLQGAGVSDELWLQAVLQHHEVEDGSGYPAGRSDVCELASLVRRADVYTSKLAARSTREAQGADVAGRAMFMQDPGHPMTQALVKEFGIFPPGCHVRLVSGEVAVVVGRGPTVTTPMVACLTDAKGQPLAAPRRVDTSHKGCGVHSLMPVRNGDARVGAEALVGLS